MKSERFTAVAERDAFDDVFDSQPRRYDVSPQDAVSAPGFEGPSDFSLDPYAGGTFRNLPILDQAGIIDQITTGRQIQANNGVISYTFLDLNHLTGLYNNPKYGFEAGLGLGSFSEAQRAEARESIQLWDDLIPQSFRESNGLGADIQFANSADPAQAYAYYPQKQGWKFQSDVFIADPALNWTNAWLGFGGYGATTLVHELGHTLGLSHPGNYNYDPSLPLTYANYAEYAQDSTQYSIMSYWGEEDTSRQPFQFGMVDFSTLFYNNPQTPLVHDILAIQAVYGADPTTRAGDTVYGWNSNAGNAVYDFSQNDFPHLAIYDAGGIDTLDMSGANASVFIDLNEGAFSSAAAAIPSAAVVNANRAIIDQVFPGTLGPVSQATMNFYQTAVPNAYANILASETGVAGLRTTSHDNIAIAYGTIIENAIGSTQRDYLVGNQVDNVLKGLGGDDVLNGKAGSDTLFGGTGLDRFVFDSLVGTDTVADFVSGADKLDLSFFDFAFIGNAAFSGANQLRYDGGMLMGDINGDGIADLIVQMNGATVVAGDLLL